MEGPCHRICEPLQPSRRPSTYPFARVNSILEGESKKRAEHGSNGKKYSASVTS
ncbi:hypothetical protein YC2023_119349 [Brassica napus]